MVRRRRASGVADTEQINAPDPDRLLWRPATDDSPRLRLFGCACYRRVWHLLPEVSRAAVEVRERYDRGEASEAEREAASESAREARRDARAPFRFAAVVDERAAESAGAWAAGAAANACSGNWVAAAKLAARAAACFSGDYAAGYRRERLAQCELFIALGCGPDAEPSAAADRGGIS
jgi:hypothetical protein